MLTDKVNFRLSSVLQVMSTKHLVGMERVKKLVDDYVQMYSCYRKQKWPTKLVRPLIIIRNTTSCWRCWMHLESLFYYLPWTKLIYIHAIPSWMLFWEIFRMFDYCNIQENMYHMVYPTPNHDSLQKWFSTMLTNATCTWLAFIWPIYLKQSTWFALLLPI